MENANNVRRKEQIKKRIRPGDLITASEMLGITTDAFRMRLNRNKEDAINAIELVLKTRDNLIQQFKLNNCKSI